MLLLTREGAGPAMRSFHEFLLTRPAPQPASIDRLHAMNAALAAYSDELRARTPTGQRFTPFRQMPGNAASPSDTGVCFR